MVSQIICKNGEVALCDDEGHSLLSRFTWYMIGHNEKGQAYPSCLIYGMKNKRFIPMHQMVTGGTFRSDHIDRDKMNNQKSNLRPSSNQQNAWNSKKRVVTCTGNPPSSEYKGVTKYQNTAGETLWRVLIKLTKKGEVPARFFRKANFKSELEAARFYNEEIVKHRGEWAYLNQLPQVG